MPNRAAKHRLSTFASFIFAAVACYFIYHAIQGDRGFIAMVQTQRQVSVSENTLAGLREEREKLEHRVGLLRSDNLDPDLLDEQSRKQLNYSKPDEIIVLVPNEEKPVLQRSKKP